MCGIQNAGVREARLSQTELSDVGKEPLSASGPSPGLSIHLTHMPPLSLSSATRHTRALACRETCEQGKMMPTVCSRCLEVMEGDMEGKDYAH